jgi:ArsR family transcriptional regulator
MTMPVYQIKANLFRTLAHPLRIRVLEALANGELTVPVIGETVEASGSLLSQHLGVLRRAGIITSRREAGSVIYSVVDDRIFDLLNVGRRILTSTLEEAQGALAEAGEIVYLPTTGG